MVGPNCTISVTAFPGLSVAGKIAPDSEKPAPVKATEFMVNGAVPVDSKEMDWVFAVVSATLPNATLISVGTAAFNCSAKVLVTPLVLAVNVAACAVPTDDTVAVNPTLVAFAATATVVGTETAELLLDKLKLRLPLGAAAARVTVQASVPEPMKNRLLQDRALNATGASLAAVPIPLRLTTAEPRGNALLEMDNRSEAAPLGTRIELHIQTIGSSSGND